MKRMCMIFIALFILAMALPVMATETRVSTMGNQHMFIQDDYNIWNWTSTVNNYPRHLIVDHNSFWGGSQAGMIVPFMKNAVVGAFFSDLSGTIPYAPLAADQRLDLFYGYRGANFDLGLHADWYGAKEETTNNLSTSIIGLAAGLGFNANGNMFEVNVSFHNLDYTNEVPTGTAVSTRDAGSVISASARYLYAYNNMVTLVPAIAISTGKVTDNAGSPVVVSETKSTAWDVGLGCNTMPLQGTEFLTSLGIRGSKDEETVGTTKVTDDKYTTIPYVALGADIQVKPWLMFRVGAEKDLVSTYEDGTVATTWKTTSSSYEYHIGAGVMLGDVQFDTEVRQGWLNDGPYLLSGEGDNGPMFTKISFKYDFR